MTSFNRRSCVIPLIFVTRLVTMSSSATGTCPDDDGDGWTAQSGCPNSGDCNDQNPAIHPGAVELCNGVDDNCDGTIDEGCDRTCDQPERIAAVTPIAPGNSVASSDLSLSWNGLGYAIAFIVTQGSNGYHLFFSRVDPLGKEIGVSKEVFPPGIYQDRPELAWTGKEYGLVFDSANKVLSFTRLSTDGSTLMPPIQINPTIGVFDTYQRHIIWNGSRFGICWEEASDIGAPDGIRFALLDFDGDLLTPMGGLLVDSQRSSSPDVAWNGAEFGLVFHSDLSGTVQVYFTRVDGDGVPVPGSRVQVTNDIAGVTGLPRIAWGPGEWGVVYENIQGDLMFLRLSPSGSPVAPAVRVTNTGPRDEWEKLIWNGAEYGLNSVDLTLGVDGDLYFERLSAAGAVPSPPIKMNASPDFLEDLAWSGRDYGVLHRDGGNLYLDRVGCNCTDNDHDGFSTCAGGDCNDNDRKIRPGVSENCSDLIDNNCDGLIDCNDSASCPMKNGTAPGEVHNDGFVNKTTYAWDPAPTATRYDVATGSISELRMYGDFSRASCLYDDTSGTSVTVGGTPLAGDAVFFMVRAELGAVSNCVRGTWGTPIRDSTTIHSCP